MKFDFANKNLVDLYTTGKSKKLKLPPNIAEKFLERINRIEAADTIFDLRIPPSMKFEKLKGFKNRFSIRLNNEYRLEFEIDFEDKEKLRGDVKILCVSNHYMQ